MMRTIALVLLLAGIPQEESFDDRVDAFSSKLVVGEDKDLQVLKVALATLPGRIVLRDRSEKAAEILRRTAERDALPNYFDSYFDKVDGMFRLGTGNETWRQSILDGYASYQAEMKRLRPILREVADNLVEEPPVNKKLKALLTHEGMLDVLYLKDIRPKTRPTVYTLEKALGEVFARDAQNRIHVPEGRRERAEDALGLVGPISEVTGELSPVLSRFGKDLAEFDDLHKRFKKIASDPLLVGVILRKSLKGGDEADLAGRGERFRAAGEELRSKLPEIAVKTPEGLVFLEKHLDGLEELIETYDQARKIADAMKNAGREFVAQMKTGDPLHDGLRKGIQNEIVLVLLGEEVSDGQVDPVEVVKARIKQAVEKTDDGKYRVRPEMADELAKELKDPAQQFKKVNREVRLMSMYGRKVEDEKLREVFTSVYGRIEIATVSELELQVKEYDGLAAWIGRHFDKTSDGYTLCQGAKAEITEILAQVKQLEAEAAQNDLEK